MNLRKNIILLALAILFCNATEMDARTKSNYDWTKVINAIIQVESNGNPNARKGKHAGVMQIAPCLVKQCNDILREKKSKKRYTMGDRFNEEKSKEMFLLIQDVFNPQNDIDWAIRAWNGGLHFKTKSTNSYLKKVKKAMQN